MITQERRVELDQWIIDALFKRFSSIRFYDPWDVYDGDTNSNGFSYNDTRYVSEYISREQLDTLIQEISRKYAHFADLDYIRTGVVNRCRYIMTCIERYCFCQNMTKLIKWSVETSQIERQLRTHFAHVGNLPTEMIDEIFSYSFPLPKPTLLSIHEVETHLYSRYIERPDLRFWKPFDDYD